MIRLYGSPNVFSQFDPQLVIIINRLLCALHMCSYSMT
jgi:hypothetical protein